MISESSSSGAEAVDEVYLKKRIPPEVYKSDYVFGDPLSNSMEDSIGRLRSDSEDEEQYERKGHSYQDNKQNKYMQKHRQEQKKEQVGWSQSEQYQWEVPQPEQQHSKSQLSDQYKSESEQGDELDGQLNHLIKREEQKHWEQEDQQFRDDDPIFHGKGVFIGESDPKEQVDLEAEQEEEGKEYKEGNKEDDEEQLNQAFSDGKPLEYLQARQEVNLPKDWVYPNEDRQQFPQKRLKEQPAGVPSEQQLMLMEQRITRQVASELKREVQNEHISRNQFYSEMTLRFEHVAKAVMEQKVSESQRDTMKELACIKHLLIKVVEMTESSNQRLEVLEDKVEEALRRK